eukprot:CAMPEP_0119155974 /NCGR_PEP_ID=MMETSP1310-20130426/52012_1 /TAXON_ID=464262 /ORGANISM="Genus nov. species nov., Strain RCC2339" /LENGTH=333 /DNA_ID=CAMNT_0007148581 /DNA_START=60 /DNA_END=1062 /DNA_ORIENTATION=+
MAEVSGEDGKTEANGAGEQVVEGGEASVEQQEGDTTVEDVAQQKSPDRRGSNSPSPSISPRGAGSSSPRRYDRRSQSPIDRRSRSPSTGRRTPSPLAGRDPEENKIFVGGIPWKLDDRDVEDMFSPFGDILDSKVMVDRASGRSRGFAFVTFKNDESVDKAIREMHQTRLEGREISVKRARVLAPEPPPRRQRRPPPRRDYDTTEEAATPTATPATTGTVTTETVTTGTTETVTTGTTETVTTGTVTPVTTGIVTPAATVIETIETAITVSPPVVLTANLVATATVLRGTDIEMKSGGMSLVMALTIGNGPASMTTTTSGLPSGVMSGTSCQA